MPKVFGLSFLHLHVQLSVALALLAIGCASVHAQETGDEEGPAVRHGLVARYTGADGTACTRLDPAIRFVWRGSPDERIPPGDFRATWHGLLLTTTPGRYTLRVFAQGEVSLAVGGDTVLDDTANEARWLDATPLELEYGYHPIRLTYASSGPNPQLKLYWEGPRFELEPISPRWLFHRPGDAPDDRFERGARLVRALRCDACHRLPQANSPAAAPALDRLPGNLSRQWVIDWLAEAAQDAPPEGERSNAGPVIRRRMPHFDLSKAEAKAITAYLYVERPPRAETLRAAVSRATQPAGSAQSGEKLFRTIGCLACHRVGKLGTSGLFGGGDLTFIAQKRPANFFARWLADPKSINAHHRMPAYTESVITAEERADLAAYLGTLSDPAGRQLTEDDTLPPKTNDALVGRGRDLVTRWRCASCHQLPDTNQAPAPPLAISDELDWDRSCLSGVNVQSYRPTYALLDPRRAAIVHYLEAVRAAPARKNDRIDGSRLLAEQNCLACHARDLEAGIAPSLAAVIEADAELGPLLPSLAPPSLTGVGDKLPDEELHRSIGGREPRLRDWLAVRMPKFTALEEAELAALAQYLIDADRMAEPTAANRPGDGARPATLAGPSNPAALHVAGSRLVTSAGFGCTGCHKIGSVAPQNVELQSRGTDLSMLSARVRRPWFDRWVRNPARAMPRMEMPSIQIPVRGVLEDDLDAQLAAVWQVLNEEGFEPPRPSPVRVVRSSNMPNTDEPAAVLTDVLESGGPVFIKPFLVGLPNRHNVLFDLESYRLAAWWIGDTARQHTRGKTWYWEPGGVHVLSPTSGGPELELLDAEGTVYAAQRQSQFVTEFDWFEHLSGGVRFASRLHFRSADSSAEVHSVTVTQTIATSRPDGAGSPATGWRRRVEVAGVPAGFTMRWWPLEIGQHSDSLQIDRQGRSFSLRAGGGACEVRIAEPADARFERHGGGVWLSIPAASTAGEVAWEVEYRTHLPVDRFFVPRAEAVASQSTTLEVVPGFEAQRLPLPRSIMPTGFAWRPDGALVVCSLKGRVWIARDTDGDGLEDTMRQFSDELAAPYGLAAHGDAVDVINKYGLLRLWDRDGDGRADRTETVASGWGHTADYHDWAIGLPRDEQGNYYIAFPCQQDDRSAAAARLRGATVRLVPRQATPDDPRLYEIEPISAGLRFPMGLARNHNGDLFVTDNQGNYNPFNELNHLVAGARYGFINELERRPGFSPPFRSPAINLPHPWTRSVNGICFLYTPPEVRERLGRDVFGPFEGHLVGCEYDTRRLIRMSVEKAGDTYQGAAYPMSLEPDDGETAFLGPVVCQVGPEGNLYVGEMRDSGWGAGANVGGIVRLRPTGTWPLGIAEVRAAVDGFVVEFTAPVDDVAAAQESKYSLVSYRRISTPNYGGADVDRETVEVQRVQLSEDARQVRLFVERLREGFVYELRVANIGGGDVLYPAEAHYTLNRIPAD